MAMQRVLGMGVLLGGLVAGCQSQAEPDYPGEPLAIVKGQVALGDTHVAGAVEAAVLWIPSYGSPQDQPPFEDLVFPVGRVGVGASFPANFTIDLLSPPPQEAFVSRAKPNGWERGPIAYGMIAAVKPGTGDRVRHEDILGVATDAGIFYAARDGIAGDPDDVMNQVARLFQVSATAGFHLYTSYVSAETETAYYSCRRFCLERTGSVIDFPETVYFTDSDTERCMQRAPQNQLCQVIDGAELPDCYIEYHSRLVDCPKTSFKWIPNPDGFNHSVTIRLGTTALDVKHPRAEL